MAKLKPIRIDGEATVVAGDARLADVVVPLAGGRHQTMYRAALDSGGVTIEHIRVESRADGYRLVDRQGRLREDGNGNARLDEDYSASGDPVIEFERDGRQPPRFRRYATDLQRGGGALLLAGVGQHMADQLKRTGIEDLLGEHSIFPARSLVYRSTEAAFEEARSRLQVDTLA